jgi:hypothetical protein
LEDKKSPIQEFYKLINPLYIKNKRVEIHPVLFEKYPNMKHQDSFVLFEDTLGRNVKSFKKSPTFEKKNAIIVSWNDKTIRFIENNKSLLNLCIPVPWMKSRHKKLLHELTSKLGISFLDPEKSGWSYL